MANPGKEGKQAKERRPQALKRDLQNEKRRLRNRSFKSNVRTVVRNFEETVATGDANATKEKLNALYSAMDKAVKRGVFKLNKASRLKARMTARLTAAKA